ncbi:MAG: CBS domain-containing protein [Snowella sp.]|nr:CBS domain-containing protein [Snowella sp.]
MLSETPFAWIPDLKDAIERYPLTVSPTTSLKDAIALINQAHSHTCLLNDDLLGIEQPTKEIRTSCVLVMQEQQLIGILTERDVVRLTAKAVNFAEATVADVMVSPVITLPQQSIQDIFAALFLFRRYRIRHLPIVDEQGQLVGMISHESIRHILRPANLLRFRRVADVMTVQVIQAPLTASLLHLAQLMAKNRVSCVVITQRDRQGNEQPVGIVTERDIVQFQAFQIDLARTQAQTVMSTPLFLLSPDDSLWTAHQEMQKRRVGRLVVSWNWGQGLGIVTQTSLLRIFDPMEMYGVIENLQRTIQQLETERSLAQPSTQKSLSAQSSSPDLFEPQTEIPPKPSLISVIQQAQDNLQWLLKLFQEEPRSQLEGVQETLETLNQQIDEVKSLN